MDEYYFKTFHLFGIIGLLSTVLVTLYNGFNKKYCQSIILVHRF